MNRFYIDKAGKMMHCNILSLMDLDPLTQAMAPPPGETREEKKERLLRERKAKMASEKIDADIETERAQRKGAARLPVKILLLGQSESGKSTMLKNFQLMAEPRAFHLEKASWRAVVQLNLVRSFRHIIDILTREHQAGTSTPSRSSHDSVIIPPELLKTKLRLTPLLAIETILIRRSDDVEATQLDPNLSYAERTKHYLKEITVNSANQWKESFAKLVHSESGRRSFESGDGIDWDDPNDPGRVLHECAEDMIQLWNDPITQVLLKRQKLRMQEFSGFFLDQIERVTAPRYIPTDDDILRARLKTVGVTEHRLTLKSSAAGKLSRDWRIFDVGGYRSQRAAWVPYFDDMDAIIFMAPISCFDQTLAEDPKTNRLADSIALWTSLTSNPLLERTNIIVFLNKIDILKAKLKAGIRFADSVTSYGNRPNDFGSTTSYLRQTFAGILKEHSPLPRVFYGHLTTVTDPSSTKLVLDDFRDMLMREHLTKYSLIP